MTSWCLELKDPPSQRVDASAISLSRLSAMSMKELKHSPLGSDGESLEIGDLFKVASVEVDEPTLRIEGDLRNIDGLGSQHHGGRFELMGDVGCRVGEAMRGGKVLVSGSAGDRPGQRMRRGDLWISGDAGVAAGAFMVAGTIVVAGSPGDLPGYGMSRGTIVTPAIPDVMRTVRFTEPEILRTPWLHLFCESLRSVGDRFTTLTKLADRLEVVVRVRGDLAVGGQGEWLCPIDSVPPSVAKHRAN